MSFKLVGAFGRRWLALGGGQVDISQIPMQTVERIEVLSDGASAIYGSDAIAGVINIITRNNFEGLEVEARYSQTGESDGQNAEVGISLGTRNDQSSIFFNINKVTQKSIGAGDRAISSVPVAGTDLALSATGEFGYFRVPGTEDWVSLLPDREIEGLDPGDRTAADFGGPVRYNYAPDNYLLTPYERLSMFLKADYQFNSNIRGFTQFTFNQRKSETAIAAVPITNFSSGPQWEIPVSADNIFNPFGADVEGSSFRMSPVGSRIRNQDYVNYFMTLGFDGDFSVAETPVFWDIAYSRGESSRNALGTNYVNLLNLRNGLGASFIDASGDYHCGTPGNIIAGCVPVNLFNGVTGMTDEMVRYLTYNMHNSVKTGTTNLSGNIAADLFELPAGEVSIAAGFEFRAPSVSDLFSGGGEGFGKATDLCSNSAIVANPYNDLTPELQARCDAVTGFVGGVPQQNEQIRQLSGGNPNLQPEGGKTTTFGTVYNPRWFDGFDISADWWKIELSDVLSSVSATTIMNNCIRDNDQTSCDFVERIPSTGEIQTIRRSSFNLANIEIEGVDVNANYRFETEKWGRFALSARSTYTISAKTTLGQLSDTDSVVGEADGAFGGPTWRVRSNFGATWGYNSWTVTWSIRHTSRLVETCTSGEIGAGVCTHPAIDGNGDVNVIDSYNRIGSVFYHDVSASYQLPWDASVRVGARNLFRKDPPMSLTAFANSYLQSYDIPGGSYFMSYRQSF